MKGTRRLCLGRFLLLAASPRRGDVDERSPEPRCATSEFPIRQVSTRVSERNAFTSDARQVERKIKRAPFSLRPSVRRAVITLLCGFCRTRAASPANLALETRVENSLRRFDVFLAPSSGKRNYTSICSRARVHARWRLCATVIELMRPFNSAKPLLPQLLLLRQL